MDNQQQRRRPGCIFYIFVLVVIAAIYSYSEGSTTAPEAASTPTPSPRRILTVETVAPMPTLNVYVPDTPLRRRWRPTAGTCSPSSAARILSTGRL